MAAAALVIAMLVAHLAGAAGGELLKNGRLTEGAGGTPEGWNNVAWNNTFSRFEWTVAEDGTGMLGIITSEQPNDARWCQGVTVEPGATYRITARVRTQDVGRAAAGAFLTIEPSGVYTDFVQGTQDWRPLELVVRAQDESSWNVCGRLGSFSNLNTGAAWFTDFSMTQVGRAPPRPSRLSQALSASLRVGWLGLTLPFAGGLLLAYGLGIFRR